ncbi:MAG: methyltransferase domain-containing protein [Clostridiales bacterium]|nr:methyltransferase domain-containing protein [Clostridiales bacterium]
MEKRDIPLNRLEQDEFGIARYVNALCEFVRDSDTPITIALQGEWGSGKTSFMRMMENNLCDPRIPEEERYDAIWLTTWDLFLENDYDTAVRKLIVSLFTQMEELLAKDNSKQDMERRRKMMKEYLKGITSLMLTAVNVDLEASGRVLDRLFGGNSSASLRQLKSDFEKFLIEETSKKNNGVTDKAFLIFVDDLDRLEPRMAITLLEAMKNLFDIEKCIFVLAIDFAVVSMGIQQKYGSSIVTDRNIAQDFFDKLIQVPYMIPVSRYDISDMVMGRLREIRFMEREYDYTKYEARIVEIFRLATNKNPRAVKRLLNMLHLMNALHLGEEERHAELRIMEILLMALQMSFPDVYRMLAGNNNLETWRRDYNAYDVEGILTEEVKKQYHLDAEWKEIVFLTVCKDEVLRRNYHRIASLLEIYELVQERCHSLGERVEDALGIVNVMYMNAEAETNVEYNGEAYDRSSQTQHRQGERLIDSVDFSSHSRVLDVGCGNGTTTIDMWNRNRDMRIRAFDLSESQIEVARGKYEAAVSHLSTEFYRGDIEFDVMNALDLSDKAAYDLVFSNATLHWITDERKMYRLLLEALEPGGLLAVHQGGYGTYAGLHRAAREAIKHVGLEEKFRKWLFPTFYPKKSEMEILLRDLGYVNIDVESVYSDEKDNQNLVDNFARASLIYYHLPSVTQEEYDALEEEYFRICRSTPVDKSSHRLYIFAQRPKK